VIAQRRVAAGSRERSGAAQRSFTLDAASTALRSVANSGSYHPTQHTKLGSPSGRTGGRAGAIKQTRWRGALPHKAGVWGERSCPRIKRWHGLPHNTTNQHAAQRPHHKQPQHAQRPRSKRRRGGASPAPFCCPSPQVMDVDLVAVFTRKGARHNGLLCEPLGATAVAQQFCIRRRYVTRRHMTPAAGDHTANLRAGAAPSATRHPSDGAALAGFPVASAVTERPTARHVQRRAASGASAATPPPSLPTRCSRAGCVALCTSFSFASDTRVYICVVSSLAWPSRDWM